MFLSEWDTCEACIQPNSDDKQNSLPCKNEVDDNHFKRWIMKEIDMKILVQSRLLSLTMGMEQDYPQGLVKK